MYHYLEFAINERCIPSSLCFIPRNKALGIDSKIHEYLLEDHFKGQVPHELGPEGCFRRTRVTSQPHGKDQDLPINQTSVASYDQTRISNHNKNQLRFITNNITINYPSQRIKLKFKKNPNESVYLRTLMSIFLI